MEENKRIDELLEYNETEIQFILDLFEAEVVKFGSFTLGGGHVTPVYFDLRLLVSHPRLLKTSARLVAAKTEQTGLVFDHVCGVPLAALPIATTFCVTTDVPMILRRKEAKSYGTKKLIEGVFKKGDTSLVLEDTVVSGRSIWETVEALGDAGVAVTDAVVLLDRKQGAKKNLEKRGVKLHSCVDVHGVVKILRHHGKLAPDLAAKVSTYIIENQFAEMNG